MKYNLHTYLVIFIVLFLNNCIFIVMHNNSNFEYNYRKYSKIENCIKFNYSFSESNLYHIGIYEKDINQSITIFKYIKDGIIFELEEYNKFNIDCKKQVPLKITINFLNYENKVRSRNNIFNAILTSLTLGVIPLYDDFSYEISFLSENKKFQVRKDFLMSFSLFNIFLYFRYEKPFFSSFRNVTKDFIFDYEFSEN